MNEQANSEGVIVSFGIIPAFNSDFNQFQFRFGARTELMKSEMN